MKRCLCNLIKILVLVVTLSTIYFQFNLMLNTHGSGFFHHALNTFPSTSSQTVYFHDSDSTNVHTVDMDSHPHNGNMTWPKICLLLTFPNSGTSYTLSSVERRTNYAVGTNYKKETLRRQPHDNTTLAFPWILKDTSSARGPYWLPGYPLPTPDMESYVLTKTHCANICLICDPTRYMSSFRTFDKICRSDRKYDLKPYSKKLVSRIARVVRNPLDNIVSRFHHARKGNIKFTKRYNDDTKGFHRFCKEQLHVYHKLEEKYFHKMTTLLSLFQGIPCYADFYRYTMWHNYAQRMVDTYPIPSLLLYYEDYETNHSMNTLLEFLNLSKYKNESMGCEDFRRGTSYHNYYSKDEIEKIWLLIKNVSSVHVWSILERYRTFS